MTLRKVDQDASKNFKVKCLLLLLSSSSVVNCTSSEIQYFYNNYDLSLTHSIDSLKMNK